MKQVLKLSYEHASDVKRLMLKEHPAGAAILLEQMIDEYFLGENIGCAIGAYNDEGQLYSLIFSSFEADTGVAVTRGMYGKVGEHTKQMLELLDKQLKAKPNMTGGVAFIMLAKKASIFKKQLLQSSLGKRLAVKLEEIDLPFGRIPSDKVLWTEILSKNIPYDNMTCIRAAFKG